MLCSNRTRIVLESQLEYSLKERSSDRNIHNYFSVMFYFPEPIRSGRALSLMVSDGKPLEVADAYFIGRMPLLWPNGKVQQRRGIEETSNLLTEG